MGRYVYDSGLVTRAIDKLNDAIKSLTDVTSEIQAGVNTINSARGSNCIDADYTKILQMQTAAEEVIEEDIRTIQSKVTIIEDYENAPWYKKLFSSIGMGLTKFVEGIASGIENIGDGVVSIAGFVGGIFSSNFKNACAEYVAKDHVGDWCAKQYESGFLSDMNKYSTFSHESTWANVFKGFGTAAPYVALSMTGVGLITETAVAGIGGIGSGTEAGLQKALIANRDDPNFKAGDAFNSAFASGLWQGTKNAALVYGMGKLAKGIQANAAGKTGVIAGSADDFAKITSGNMDDVAATAKKLLGTSDDLVAQSVNGRIQIHNAKTLEVVGDVVSDGSKAIFRNLGNNATGNVFTRVMSSSGDDILYNSLKNTDDLLASSFDDLAKANTLTKADKVFQKAGKVKDTKLGHALQASDDALTAAGSKIANSKAGQAVSKLTGKVTDSKFVKGTINTIKNSKVAQVATNFVKNHPVATYGAAATVFTADQIDEDVINSQYRLANADAGVVGRNDVDPGQPTPPDPDDVFDPNDPDYKGKADDNNNKDNNNTDNNKDNNTNNNNNDNNTNNNSNKDNNTNNNSNKDNNTNNNSNKDNNTNNDTNKDNNTNNNNNKDNNTNNNNNKDNNTNNNNNKDNNTNNNTNNNNNNNNSNNNSNNKQNGGNSGSQFGGGEFSDKGYKGDDDVEIPGGESVSGSFTDIIGGNEYTNIPTSAAPITTTTTEGGKKSVIPVIAGLSAAAVAGIGTKAYLDKKENSSEEEFNAEEWEEQDELDINYNEAMEEDGDYLNPSDEYAYQDGDDQATYEAVNSSELASMQ